MVEQEYKDIAREIGDCLANDEDFQQYVKWCMLYDESILDELDIILEEYYINRHWKEYRRNDYKESEAY